ncbi:imelysin family protein [Arcobacter sp. CECT 8985]|uniref:imelysin family protein n=1 Tax=Arcobacter sp. CECT 8985 TaxID=1935424 RepID=UPI00100AD19B|nr:imelysin family protein [Arcobacter sp. CECT 8985]RXJ87244.1 imelysin [Arcobacter sp. CECT 8985]
MKKIVILFMFLFSFGFSNTFTQVVKNVSLPNANEAIKDLKALEKSYSKDDFKKFVYSWKKVQALYLAGTINSDYIDEPRYIDTFHQGHEDIIPQIKRAIKSTDKPQIALFKNSNKSINAVEFMLYKSDKKLTKREKVLLSYMLKAIESHLKQIQSVYADYAKNNKETIDEKTGNGAIINTLIDSTYKLKEWRVGEPAGLTMKYKNDPDNKRGEYYLSQQSFAAIKAILDAHEQVIGDQKYKNFATMAIYSGAKKQVIQVRDAIKKAKAELAKLKTDDFSNAQNLYKALVDFHNSYYLSLIEQLSVTAKILEADGD